MTFTNCFHTNMTASANHAEAPFTCANFASNNAIALILDAVIAASIIIALISITLITITLVLVLGLSVLLVLVLVVLLVLEEVNRHRRRQTA
ncbi:hypothetical protein [Oscillibacter sp.]|uniref:hypothetical protein n=1 Tax=Oscillibacter sp. TaxID=1945593 RepID=UPI00339A334B